jgi:hypothetical protein
MVDEFHKKISITSFQNPIIDIFAQRQTLLEENNDAFFELLKSDLEKFKSYPSNM